jgi:hypothetical protein
MRAAREIFAELLLDDRAPERSGLRLIEWAAFCGASGVVIPHHCRGGSVAEILAKAAADRELPCVAGPVKDAYTDALPHPWRALAAALGGRKVVKGLTLNRSLGGPPHAGGLYPHEFRELVTMAGPAAPLSAGDGALEHAQSLVAKGPLKAGTLLKPDLLEARPGLFGITADEVERLNDVKLLFDRAAGGRITFGMIEPMSGRSAGTPLWLTRTLSALRHQQRPPKEIIVVDNESTDETVGIAERFGCRVLSISDRKFSYGGALNAGIAASGQPWVVSLSAHCIPVHDRWLETFAHQVEAPFAAAAYGRQEPLPDSNHYDKRDLWTTFGEERRVQVGRDFFFHNANSLINRAVWERIPFDESLNGVEDRDWAKKVLSDGFHLVYQPLASVHHYHGIHQGRDAQRSRRVVKVIEFIQQRDPALELAQQQE